ncbi:MAG: TonB-dependent receptor, partial [Nitrospirota bacterium]|nr:TonB-dependent receptor [Nitrospirota bacterium]
NDYERGAIDLTLSGKWEKWNGLAKVYRNFGEHEFSDGWHSKDFTNGMVLHGSARLFTGNELTMGLELRQQGGKKLATAKQPNSGEWDKTEYAVFFHDEQTLLEKLILTFGARYNYDDISGNDLSPQAGLVFHPIEGTIFRGTINKGFRSPQLNELYMFPPSNPDLKPERVWNYEVGINQRIVKGLYFDLVGFLMKGEGLIERDPITNKFQNIGEFEFKGIEAGLNVQFNKELSGSIYYSYLNPGEKTTGRPGDKFDLVLMYTGNKLAASLSGQYVADYFAADKKQKPIGDYFVASAKVSYEIKRGIRPFLAVDNIFGEKYEIYADLPGAEAGLYAMPRTALTAGISFVF